MNIVVAKFKKQSTGFECRLSPNGIVIYAGMYLKSHSNECQKLLW